MTSSLHMFLHLHSSLIHLSTPVANGMAYISCTGEMTPLLGWASVHSNIPFYLTRI